jgi:hypothetical protein
MGTTLSWHNPNLLLARLVRETRATAAVGAHLKRHAAEVTAREAQRCAEDAKSTLEWADKTEAKVGALTEALSESSDLRRKVASLRAAYHQNR